MNIFYLDSDPQIVAQAHNDKHVVKMILETAQLLSTAHRTIDGAQEIVKIHGRTRKLWKHPDPKLDSILYKATHINHPCSKWLRESKKNYEWLYKLFCELCKEYKYRYDKTHLCEKKLIDVLSNVPRGITKNTFTQPPQAMPEQYRSNDSIYSYRQYYIKEKNHLAKWTRREIPNWYQL
jgi:hypothetical protein